MNIVSLDFFFLEVSFVIYILLKIIHFCHNLNLISMELSRVISYDHLNFLYNPCFFPTVVSELVYFCVFFFYRWSIKHFRLNLSVSMSVCLSFITLSGCKEPAHALLVLSFLNHQFIFYVY